MKISLRHTMRFGLGSPAHAAEHLLLTPLSTPQQKVERWSIEMPGITEAAAFRDAFGNRAHLVTQTKPEGELVVTISGVVETFDKAGVIGRLEYDPMPALFRRPTAEAKTDPALIEGLSQDSGRIALLHELMERVHQAIGTPAQMQVQGAQGQAQGGEPKPQDFAHAFIGAARALGISARYVTGYVIDEETASFHAWAEAWDDGLGWIGFDAALNLCPAETHVRLASGLDAISTMPIRCVPVWSEMPAETVELVAE